MTRREMTFGAMAAAANADTAKDPNLDPVAYSRMRHAESPLRMRFTASTEGAAKAWQRKLRTKVTELIGGFPANRVALAPRTLETKSFGTYTREKFLYTSREGMDVLAYLLKPAKAKGPLPVMLCIPGHGRGVDDVVGIDEKGNERTDKSGYMKDFAISMAEQGVAALAIEPAAFGARRDPISKGKGATANACQPAAGAALLLGETMIAWRVYDTMRAIDYIETRPDLDPKRVGCMGISGGGTCTLFAMALDTRIKTAMISGYLCTFRDCILSLSHCMDNYVPGILNWAEMSDIAGLVAPRPLFCESGEQDKIFPLAGFNQAFSEVEKIYSVFGARENLDRQIHPYAHVFHGEKGIPFLIRHL